MRLLKKIKNKKYYFSRTRIPGHMRGRPTKMDPKMTGRRWYGGKTEWTNSQTASLGDPVKPYGRTQQTRSKRQGYSGNSCFGDEMYKLNRGDHTPLFADSAKTMGSSLGYSKSTKKDKGVHSLGQGVKKRQTTNL